MDFIDIHTHATKQCPEILSIINIYPNNIVPKNNPFSIGIHPWYITENNLQLDFKNVEQKLYAKNCLAIGECGLDKLSKTNYNLQISVFKKHILLSEKYNKPLIIHCVKAFNDIIHLKKEHKPQQQWIIHGFNKNKQIANDLIKNNIIISIGASFLRKEKLQNTIKEIPVENIFLETDDSNEPIKNIYNKFAQIKEKDLSIVKQKITENFNRIFIV
ncbi:TatD DNase family protein [Tenacibaculum sp. MAR_2010_89]|uniref:TatD family hydrolase n=1 Tax=Tenacibaculum sp. MAR_2010_89 TaxID=1250198 RepID=UPI0008948AB9|nr:TatD family hydrolase [Tenacibaculum sp. MAR_2010_89]SEE25161.1 TatD DNase family protein [Tenacibaculum sp. MAR_2010_89]